MAFPDLPQQYNLFVDLVTKPDLFAKFRQDPAAALADYQLDTDFLTYIHERLQTVEDVEKQLDILSGLMGEEASPPKMANGGSKTSTQDVPPRRRIVNTGVVSDEQPDTPLASNQTLINGRVYHFWLDISETPSPHSIESTPTSLPPDLPANAQLDIVLFDFSKEGSVLTGKTRGKIQLEGSSAKVISPADIPGGLANNQAIQMSRLFFTIQTPATPGTVHLRCNIYYQQSLLQSRLVTLLITTDGKIEKEALMSTLDYTITQTFATNQLENLKEKKLSLLVNDDGNGSHGFRLFGQNEFVGSATLTESQIRTLINTSRQELRRAAWGDKEPFQPGKKFYYSDNLDLPRLSIDLIRLALRGYEFYDSVITNFAGGVQNAFKLADLMRQPGYIQIAAKESIQLVLPAAMIYDHPLDNGLTKAADYSLCGDFLANLGQDKPLEETDCFLGKCPSYGEDTVVCPSGFWGYRHHIGLPISIKSAPDAPILIESADPPLMAVSVSTDPQFEKRPSHEKKLQALGVGWAYADSRDDSLDMLQAIQPQIVYYYCHGGLSNGRPFIQVGPKNGGRITPANLRLKRIFFDKIRPLVFINGCHTTALTPENGFDMVTAFVQNAHAAGIIGTEITIFESIAVAFAESFFDRFLIQKQDIGVAVRGARLEMLKSGSPFGLVYVPYVMPDLKLN